jgi:hypothetical protein
MTGESGRSGTVWSNHGRRGRILAVGRRTHVSVPAGQLWRWEAWQGHQPQLRRVPLDGSSDEYQPTST